MRSVFMVSKKTLAISVIIILAAGCATTYTIDSTPGNANVFMDGTLRGETPYTDIENIWIGTKHTVTLKKEGFEAEEFILKPTVWVGRRVALAIIFPPLWFWVKTYPSRSHLVLNKTPESKQQSELEVENIEE